MGETDTLQHLSNEREGLQNFFLHERYCKFAERTFRKTLAMSSPDAFGANQTYNAERQAGSIGSFGVTSAPESYTSRDDDSAGANMPENRDPIYVNR